jgi:hypothetical protein
MKNVGYIYVDDGYPESADYDSNYICYDRDEPDGYKEAMAEASAQLRLEKLNSSEVPAPGTSALRFARLQKTAAPFFRRFLSDALKPLSDLLSKWRQSGRGKTRRGESQSTTGVQLGKRHAFGW